jgi:hypothetical protein
MGLLLSHMVCSAILMPFVLPGLDEYADTKR